MSMNPDPNRLVIERWKYCLHKADQYWCFAVSGAYVRHGVGRLLGAGSTPLSALQDASLEFGIDDQALQHFKNEIESGRDGAKLSLTGKE